MNTKTQSALKSIGLAIAVLMVNYLIVLTIKQVSLQRPGSLGYQLHTTGLFSSYEWLPLVPGVAFVIWTICKDVVTFAANDSKH